MAYFRTTFETRATPKLAFEYLADFSNAREWDPSVSAARRLDDEPVGVGSRFSVEVGLPIGAIAFEYELLRHEPERSLVFVAETTTLRSLDTITIEPTGAGSTVHYDADLRTKGLLYAFDLALHLGFQVSGERSARGLARALDELA